MLGVSSGEMADNASIQKVTAMEDKKFCPKCDKTRLAKIVQKEEDMTVRDVRIRVVSTLTACSVCGEIFATEAQEEENIRKAYDEYRKLKGLLTPSEVRAVRTTYGLSQTNFSRWLGWGDITMHRYEAGSLQDAAHNETLFLLRDPRNAKALLDKTRNDLDEASAERLQKTVAALLNTEVGQLIESDLATSLNMVPPSEFNGYRRFDIDRFENLGLYILEEAGPTFKTAMNKFLWYIDFGYFREQTQSITGAQYLKFQHGPIPKSYDFLFASMLEKGCMEVEEVHFPTKSYVGERYIPLVKANTDLFQGNELKSINKWIALLKGKSSKALSDLAHKEKAYLVTEDKTPISYNHANELKLRLPAAVGKSR